MRGIADLFHRYIIPLTLSPSTPKSDILAQFAARLLGLREERGQTRAEVAEKSGLSSDQVRFWEMGRSNPTLQDLAKLAAHYRVSVHWLLTGAGPVEADHLVFGEADRPPRDMLEKRLLDWATEGRIGSRAAIRAFLIASQREQHAWEAIQSVRRSLASQKLASTDREQMRQMVAMMAANAGIDPDKPPFNERMAHLLREFRDTLGVAAAEALSGDTDLRVVSPPVDRGGHTEQIVRRYGRAAPRVEPKAPVKKKTKRGA